MMVNVGRGPTLSFLIVIAILSCCIFMKGFFPVKSMIHERSTDASLPPEAPGGGDAVERPTALFDRCIVMVIDALRADFILAQQELMPFTQKLISDGHALAYTAYSHPPTVTLPRIKALMTGTIPGFVDVVMNFGSTELKEDNLIDQLIEKGKKAVFFGDDTWLKLFPNNFERSDGTISFFVADYTEVDDNVTRHLDRELAAQDWSLMVLHYLGLDHIGHFSGLHSPLIPPKLREMDGIVQKIYNAMTEQGEGLRTLLLLCGDHGMTDIGGHGGASPGETTVPLLFISPSFHQPRQDGDQFESVQQVDAAPTLATVLGLPIPVNSLGLVLPKVLSGLPVDQVATALRINAAQVLNVLQHNTPSLEKEEGYWQYVTAGQGHDVMLGQRGKMSREEWEPQLQRTVWKYSRAVRTMAARIAQAATNYDMYALSVGMSFFWMLVVVVLLLARQAPRCSISVSASHLLLSLVACLPLILGHVTLCTGWGRTSFLCQTSLAGAVTQAALFLSALACLTPLGAALLQKRKETVQTATLGRLELLLGGGALLHTVSLQSSSFVEEEHQTWYFLTMSFHLLGLTTLLPEIWSPAPRTGKRLASDCERYDPCGPGTGALDSGNDNDEKESGRLQHTSCKTPATAAAHTEDSLHCRTERERTSTHQLGPPGEESVDPLRRLKGDAGLHRGRGRRGVRKDVVWSVVSLASAAALCRVLRAWNQTGDKWLHLPDIGDWLNSPACKLELSVAVLLSLLLLLALWWRHLSRPQTLAFLAACLAVYCFRAAQGNLLLPGVYTHLSRGVLEAQAAYLCAGLLLLVWGWGRWEAGQDWWREERGWRQLQAAWLVVMLLLLRPHNIPLAALLCLVERLLGCSLQQRLGLGPASTALWCSWLGQASFFMQGNSNSVSAVDLSAGFVGVDFYCPPLHALLIILATWACPIYWDLATVRCLCTHWQLQLSPSPQHRAAAGLLQTATVLLLRRVLVLAVYTALMTAQRYHLFIWTVFSPKLLYEGVYLVHTGLLSLVLALLAWRIGSPKAVEEGS